MNIKEIVFKSDYHGARREYDNLMFIGALNAGFEESMIRLCRALYGQSRKGEKMLSGEIRSHIEVISIGIVSFLHKEWQNQSFFIPKDGVSGEGLLPDKEAIIKAIESWCRSVLYGEYWRIQGGMFWDNYLEAWLNYTYASIVAEKLTSVDSIDYLSELVEKGDYYFYRRFCETVNQEWYNSHRDNLIANDRSDAEMIDTTRKMSHQDLRQYIEDLSRAKDKGLSLWKYTKEYVSGAEYIMLDDELELKNHILWYKSLDDWCEFWLNLDLPIIQSSVFNRTNHPDSYLDITETINKKTDIKPRPYVYMILLEEWFDSCYNVGSRLSFYEDEDDLKCLTSGARSEGLLQLGMEQNRLWQTNLDTMIERALGIFGNILSATDIEEWLFDKPIRDGRHNRHQKLYNDLLSRLTSKYLQSRLKKDEYVKTLLEGDIEIYNLQHFIFLCNAIDNLKKTKEDVAKKIMDAFVSFTGSTSYFWNQNFEEMYLDAMRGIAMLLSSMENPVNEAKLLLDRVKLFFSGWNVDPEYNYKHINAEIFMFCAVGLLLEKDEVWEKENKSSFFSCITDRLFQQIYNGISLIETYYQRPLFLYYIIASQILSAEDKEWFEKKTIDEIDDLMTVFSVLGTDKIGLADSNSILLKERTSVQLPFLKQRLGNNLHNRQQIERLNSYIVNLGL
jgi:hypothetical protein